MDEVQIKDSGHWIIIRQHEGDIGIQVDEKETVWISTASANVLGMALIDMALGKEEE